MSATPGLRTDGARPGRQQLLASGVLLAAAGDPWPCQPTPWLCVRGGGGAAVARAAASGPPHPPTHAAQLPRPRLSSSLPRQQSMPSSNESENNCLITKRHGWLQGGWVGGLPAAGLTRALGERPLARHLAPKQPTKRVGNTLGAREQELRMAVQAAAGGHGGRLHAPGQRKPWLDPWNPAGGSRASGMPKLGGVLGDGGQGGEQMAGQATGEGSGWGSHPSREPNISEKGELSRQDVAPKSHHQARVDRGIGCQGAGWVAIGGLDAAAAGSRHKPPMAWSSIQGCQQGFPVLAVVVGLPHCTENAVGAKSGCWSGVLLFKSHLKSSWLSSKTSSQLRSSWG